MRVKWERCEKNDLGLIPYTITKFISERIKKNHRKHNRLVSLWAKGYRVVLEVARKFSDETVSIFNIDKKFWEELIS
jgi:hypothetical protein